MNQEIKYSLTKADLLEFQMFTSAQTESHRSQRLRSTLWVFLLSGGSGYYVLNRGEETFSYYLFGTALLWLAFSKSLLKRRYERHFRKHIGETKQGMIDVEATLQIGEEGLVSKSSDGHGNLDYSGIESLTELKGIFLIKTKQALTLIVPKGAIESEELERFMKTVAEKQPSSSPTRATTAGNNRSLQSNTLALTRDQVSSHILVFKSMRDFSDAGDLAERRLGKLLVACRLAALQLSLPDRWEDSYCWECLRL